MICLLIKLLKKMVNNMEARTPFLIKKYGPVHFMLIKVISKQYIGIMMVKIFICEIEKIIQLECPDELRMTVACNYIFSI